MTLVELITAITTSLTGIAIISTAIVFIVRWTSNVNRRLDKFDLQIESINSRIDNIPKEIENTIIRQLMPFASQVILSQPNPLTKEQKDDMSILLSKLEDSSITLNESNSLKKYLEIEKQEAIEHKKNDLLLAIGIVLAAIALIFAFSKSKE